MDIYRYASKSPIETTDGNYIPAGITVEFPAYGPYMSDTGKRIRELVKNKYGVTI